MVSTSEKGQAEVPQIGRVRWTPPAVRRLRAGAAEQGGSTVTDLGVAYS
jgi:hypothetical protein